MGDVSNYKKFENVGIRSSNDTLIVIFILIQQKILFRKKVKDRKYEGIMKNIY